MFTMCPYFAEVFYCYCVQLLEFLRSSIESLCLTFINIIKFYINTDKCNGMYIHLI